MKSPSFAASRGGRFRFIAALLVALLAVVGLAAYLVDRHDQLPEDAAFRVGQYVETVDSLDRRADVLKAMYGVKAPAGESAADRYQRDLAKAVAVQYLLVREAGDHDIHVTNQAAERALTEMIENTLGAERSQYTQFLSSSGVSHQQVLDELKSILLTNQLREKIVADVKAPSAEQVRAMYDSKRADMVSAESRHTADIVVADRATALVVVRELRSGKPFADVAATYSQDGSTSSKGGDLGWHKAVELETAFATAAFKAAPDEVFGPVQTTHGWNVGKVLGVRPGKKLSFAEVQATLEHALFAEAQNERWQDWLGRVIKDAQVEYADKYRPAKPNEIPSSVGQTPAPAHD